MKFISLLAVQEIAEFFKIEKRREVASWYKVYSN